MQWSGIFTTLYILILYYNICILDVYYIHLQVGSGGGSGGRISIQVYHPLEFDGVFYIHSGGSGRASIRPAAGGTLYVSYNNSQGSYLTSSGGGQSWMCKNGSVTAKEIVIRDTTMLVPPGAHIKAASIFKFPQSTPEIDLPSRRLNEISPAAGEAVQVAGWLQLGSPWPTLGRNSLHTHYTPLRASPIAFPNLINWVFRPWWRGANFSMIARRRLTQPVLDKLGILYYGLATYVIAVNTNTKEMMWWHDFHCLIWGALTIAVDGTVYGACDGPGNRPNVLFALHPWGALKWTIGIDGSRSTPLLGKIIRLKLYFCRSCL